MQAQETVHPGGLRTRSGRSFRFAFRQSSRQWTLQVFPYYPVGPCQREHRTDYNRREAVDHGLADEMLAGFLPRASLSSSPSDERQSVSNGTAAKC